MTKKAAVLIETKTRRDNAFAQYAEVACDTTGAAQVRQGEAMLQKARRIRGLGLEVTDEIAPVPLFIAPEKARTRSQLAKKNYHALEEFVDTEESIDLSSETSVISCTVNQSQLEKLRARKDLTVYPNSEIAFFGYSKKKKKSKENEESDVLDLARSNGGLDGNKALKGPNFSIFRPGVPVQVIRNLLSVETVWREGFRGQNIVVGVIDWGVDGTSYPVVGGCSNPKVKTGARRGRRKESRVRLCRGAPGGCSCGKDLRLLPEGIREFCRSAPDVPGNSRSAPT